MTTNPRYDVMRGPWRWANGDLWADHGARPVVLSANSRDILARNPSHGTLEPIKEEWPVARLIAAAPDFLAKMEALLAATGSTTCPVCGRNAECAAVDGKPPHYDDCAWAAAKALVARVKGQP
jgi:hypothetical protein